MAHALASEMTTKARNAAATSPSPNNRGALGPATADKARERGRGEVRSREGLRP